MKKLQMLCAVMVVCGESGCDLQPFEPAEGRDQTESLDAAAGTAAVKESSIYQCRSFGTTRGPA